MTNETKRAWLESVWMYRDTLGQWKPFLTERHRQDAIDSGDLELREFYSYASPVDAAMERDATRYRWLRTHFKFANDSTREIWFDGDTLVDEPSELDESIDAAITAQQQESGHE